MEPVSSNSHEASSAADLERWKFERDLELKRQIAEQDFQLRREDLELKRRDASKALWSSPLVLAIIGLIATILANVAQNFFQSRATRDLERQRFESTLVQKAVETNDSTVAADRLQFLVDLGLVRDETGKIRAYVKNPGTIPLQPTALTPPGEEFRGGTRKAARLAIGARPVEHFESVTALLATLPDARTATQQEPALLNPRDSPRVGLEQRNVRVRAVILAASRENNNDYNLVFCDAVHQTRCILAGLSGIPEPNHPSYKRLQAARQFFNDWFRQNFNGETPGQSYDFYDPPLVADIEGSLLFDARAGTGGVGPQSLRSSFTKPWRIHPVTDLRFVDLP